MARALIVVEGAADVSAVKAIGFRFVRRTDGTHVSRETIAFLQAVSRIRPVVLLLDPDGPGRTVRAKILKEVPPAVVIDGIKASDGKKNGRVGIAYVAPMKLQTALGPYWPDDETEKDSVSLDELRSLGLSGPSSRPLRLQLAARYNLQSLALKSVHDELCALGVTAEELNEVFHV